jgi:hydroxyethylthiazole kinase
VWPIHSKMCFFGYQMGCICVLNKTQTQPRYQTGSKACLELVGLRPSVIRGNGSEIIALSKASVGATKVLGFSLHENL